MDYLLSIYCLVLFWRLTPGQIFRAGIIRDLALRVTAAKLPQGITSLNWNCTHILPKTYI